MYTHTNPYKTQNMYGSPAHKAMKTFNSNTINTLQIQRPKEVASELRRTSYKHTLWKLMYTIQDEHMLSSMDSKNVR